MTLLFLGEKESPEEIWESASAAVAGLPAPEFTPKGVVGVPRRRPRLFALDLVDEGARGAAMQSAAAGALGEELERPFWPHVTLLRVRRGRRPEAPRPRGDLVPFAPVALTLYRSTPGPKGSRYEPLGSTRL